LESLDAEGKVDEDAGGENDASSPPIAEEADGDGGVNAETGDAEKDIANIASQVETTKLEGPDDSRADEGSADESAAPEEPADDSVNDDAHQDEEVTETRSQVETPNGSISGESLASKDAIEEPPTSVTKPEESAGQTAVEEDAVEDEEERGAEDEQGSSTEPATESDVPTKNNDQGQGETCQTE